MISLASSLHILLSARSKEIAMKALMILLVLGAFVAMQMGCEAKVDDDGAKVKVDTDK
jgi:hypothetical protein